MRLCNIIHKGLTSISYFSLSLVGIHLALLCLISVTNIAVYEFEKVEETENLSNFSLNTHFIFLVLDSDKQVKHKEKTIYSSAVEKFERNLKFVKSV
jgi:hypothetical protein